MYTVQYVGCLESWMLGRLQWLNDCVLDSWKVGCQDGWKIGLSIQRLNDRMLDGLKVGWLYWLE